LSDKQFGNVQLLGQLIEERPKMQLSIVGCPDKKRFRPYVKRAAQFYAQELISEKMLENIFIRIKFNSKMDAYGYASVEDYNDSGKPREFEIEIHPGIGASDILKTLAHEMVHIKQYVYGETNERLTRWKGQRVDADTVDYWVQPWEIEAHGFEAGLFTKFAIQEKLWDVFQGVVNPDTDIEVEPIGWKNIPQESVDNSNI
jgi:hypothetical protein